MVHCNRSCWVQIWIVRAYGADFHPFKRDMIPIKALPSSLTNTILAIKSLSVTVYEVKKLDMTGHRILVNLTKKMFRFRCKMFVTDVVKNDMNISILQDSEETHLRCGGN